MLNLFSLFCCIFVLSNDAYMVARETQTKQIREIIDSPKSAFVAITGRRRVGKTFLIDQALSNHFSFRMTGIQEANTKAQIINFTEKLAEYWKKPIVTVPKNWQEAFILFKQYLHTCSPKRKHVLFFDELPWISTHKSGFIQLFAHLWNDYLSKHSHFIVVICGSSTSWIAKNIVNDRGGFHNRITHSIHLKPFTLAETKQFLLSRKIRYSENAIIEIYMMLGGIPFYLEQIQNGESPTMAIQRLCFSEQGILKNEYQNLYKAIFDQPINHEAIVKTLANASNGLLRSDIATISGVKEGGPLSRALEDLVICGFVQSYSPFGNTKRDSKYKLVDEYSLFYHRFMLSSSKTAKNDWAKASASQSFKIWSGYAFENLCFKNIDMIKKSLGISSVYTEISSYSKIGDAEYKGFQIDLIIDRNDKTINLCECKYYTEPFKIDKTYAANLAMRKSLFRSAVKTRKTLFITLITHQTMISNEYSLDVVDAIVELDKLF